MKTISTLKHWFENLFYVKEMEFFFDIPSKEFGFRVVRRRLFPRKDGWREYSDKGNSISVPLGEFRRFASAMEEGESFISSCLYSYQNKKNGEK